MSGAELALVIIAVAVVLLALITVSKSVKVIQQGSVGVVKRLGRYKAIREPGIPVADEMGRGEGGQLVRAELLRDLLSTPLIAAAAPLASPWSLLLLPAVGVHGTLCTAGQ